MTSVVTQVFQSWKGAKEFGLAQLQVAVILTLAWCGNNFPKSYPRNDNHNMPMFYAMNAAFLLAGLMTLHHDVQGSSRGVQLLSRPQTEEWKGWMQWAFIMVSYFLWFAILCLAESRFLSSVELSAFYL
jgi:hypothetical protein